MVLHHGCYELLNWNLVTNALDGLGYTVRCFHFLNNGKKILKIVLLNEDLVTVAKKFKLYNTYNVAAGMYVLCETDDHTSQLCVADEDSTLYLYSEYTNDSDVDALAIFKVILEYVQNLPDVAFVKEDQVKQVLQKVCECNQ